MKPITQFNPAPSKPTARPVTPMLHAPQVQPVRFSGSSVPSDFLPRLLKKVGDFFHGAYEWLLVKPYEWLRNQFNTVVGWFKRKPKPADAADTATSKNTSADAKPSTPLSALNPKELMNDLTPLFGKDLKAITFKQASGSNTCYLLASLDSIFNHPQGPKILKKIKFYQTPDGYTVKFPGQKDGIFVSNTELVRGGGVSSATPGVRLIEQAYLKIPGAKAITTEDESAKALEHIFGKKIKQTETITMQNEAGRQQFLGGVEFPFESRKKQLKTYLGDLNDATDSTDVDVMTAIKNGGRHYYSIRLNQSEPTKIRLADPFDTADKSAEKTVLIDDFLNTYHIEGMRLSIKDLPTITQA